MVFILKIIFKFLNNKIFFIKAYNMILYYDLYVLVNEKKNVLICILTTISFYKT